MAEALPRGIRDNNPGNLEKSANLWKGLDHFDGVYCIFHNSEYGLRAMYLDLWNKNTKDGLRTLPHIIYKYAPPSDNETEAYIVDVLKYLGLNPKDPQQRNGHVAFEGGASGREFWKRVGKAIIAHENGPAPIGWHTNSRDWYTDQEIDFALSITGH